MAKRRKIVDKKKSRSTNATSSYLGIEFNSPTVILFLSFILVSAVILVYGIR